MHASLPAYFSTWSSEIASRADRVRQLIGSRHWLSDGTHKEFLIREFLCRHLPPSLSVGRGFIRSLTKDDVSREVDILVTDPSRHAPLFNEGGLLVVAPSATIATIEIKSAYRLSALKDALENVVNVRSVSITEGTPDSVWSAVMFATIERFGGARQIIDDLENVLATTILRGEGPSPTPGLLPSVVCILDSCLVLLDKGSSTEAIQVRAFEAGELSGAFAFAQLFAFVRATLSSTSTPGEMGEMLERVEGLTVYAREVRIK